jgi:processive 1,2-diacylglycerol beta-glucosyltransferase
MDVIPNSSFIFRLLYVWSYYAMLKYAPSLWDKYFANRVEQVHKSTAPEWTFKVGCSRVFRKINAMKPNLIVATEVGACEIGRMIKRQRPEMKLAGVVTDYEGEPIWSCPEVDWFSVSLPLVRDQLVEWGAPAEKIEICGIPVDGRFSKRPSADERERILRDFGLTADRPIALVMSGGMGFTRMDHLIKELIDSGLDAQVIAVTGQDQKMKRRLEELKGQGRISLNVLGWCNRVHDLMHISDLLVSKPGGMTITEALAVGIPIVAFDPLPGAEVKHCEYLSENGAGVYAKGYKQTAQAICSLLNDRDKLKQMGKCANEIAKPQAAEIIAQHLIGLVEAGPISTTAEFKRGNECAVA